MSGGLPAFPRRRTMAYWLMKSEPDECSIDDVLAAKNRITPGSGVRNYEERNYMRDHMKMADGMLSYPSRWPGPGVPGRAEVSSVPYPDVSQFDRKSPYYDKDPKKNAP